MFKKMVDKVINGVTLNNDLAKDFIDVFDTPSGKRVLEYLEKKAKMSYPDYDNINKNYSKGGQLEMIDDIKKYTNMAKTKK